MVVGEERADEAPPIRMRGVPVQEQDPRTSALTPGERFDLGTFHPMDAASRGEGQRLSKPSRGRGWCAVQDGQRRFEVLTLHSRSRLFGALAVAGPFRHTDGKSSPMSRTQRELVRSGLAAIRDSRKAGFQRRRALLVPRDTGTAQVSVLV